MLAAVLGHLAPPLWKEMAAERWPASGRVGHLEDYAELVEFLKTSNDGQGGRASGRSREDFRRWPSSNRQAEHYAEVVRLAEAAHEQLVQAYVLAQPSKLSKAAPAGTTREPAPTTAIGIARPRNWPRTASTWSCPTCSGAAWPTTRATCCRAARRSRSTAIRSPSAWPPARKHGLQVHVWKVNWNLSTAPREFVEKIRERATATR